MLRAQLRTGSLRERYTERGRETEWIRREVQKEVEAEKINSKK